MEPPLTTNHRDTATHVAIIGAGVGGLALALQLLRQGIDFDVYDARTATQHPNIGATVALAPNCLRLLDDLGVYARTRPLGSTSERVNVVDGATLQTTETYCVGDVATFGYPNLRIYRREVVDQMRLALEERGAAHRLHWNAKFHSIVRDDDDGVVFELADGTTHTAGMLVGADGIHSRVRKHVTPLEPTYAGTLFPMAIVTGAVPRPPGQPDFALPAAVQCAKGSYMIIPQRADKSETLCFRQLAGFPERDRAGWAALASDKDALLALLRADKAEWPPYIQSVMDAATPDNMSMWAVHQMADLARWTSGSRRVVLIGDAAHAVSPASGQGAAQAVEDAYSLGLVLGAAAHDALDFWQARRAARVARIKDLAAQNTIRRLPDAERERAMQGRKMEGRTLESMAWLHGYKLKDEFAAWLREHEGEGEGGGERGLRN